MAQIDTALNTQKRIGEKIRVKLESFKTLAVERKTYDHVKNLKAEAEALLEELIKNHEFLRNCPEMAKDHSYFVKQYYEYVESIYREYILYIGKTLRELEKANPDLAAPKGVPSKQPSTGGGKTETGGGKTETGGGKTETVGGPFDLEGLFKAATDGDNYHFKNISMSSDNSSNRIAAIMQRVSDKLDELRNAEDANDKEHVKLVVISLKRSATLLENCDLTSNPSCDINQYFDLIQGIDKALMKHEKSDDSDASRVVAKLPKLNVPFFFGEYTQYRSFKELFEKMIGNKTHLDCCEKLAYLRGQLKGTASDLLSTLPIENASYPLAWKILDDRYENRHIVMANLMRKLLKGPVMEKYNVDSMRKTTDEISKTVGLIVNLGITMDPRIDTLFYYLIENRIDNVTMNTYQLKLDEAGNFRGYTELMEFLQMRIKMLSLNESSKTGQDKKPKKQFQFKEYKSQQNGNKTALLAANNSIKTYNQCDCKVPHYISKCPAFTALDFNKKLATAQKWNMCINCLTKGHGWRKCNVKNNCKKCTRKHHTLMHIDKKPTALLGTAIKNENFDHVFLATAIIDVIGSNGKPYQARALLDSGSQINIMTQKLSNKIKARCNKLNMKITGVGASEIESKRRANIMIKSKASGFTASLEAFILKDISTCQPAIQVDIKGWNIPKNINLADPMFNIPASIDLIIGGELFFKLISIGFIGIGESLPDLQNTVFGWVVTGKVLGLHQQQAFVGMIAEPSLDQQISNFWRVEERYQEERSMTQKERDCEEFFDKTTMRDIDTGKFIVNLQFLQEPSVLGDSKHMAIRRFLYLEKRFKRDPQLKAEYITFLREYEQLEHMTEVKAELVGNKNYFIPHHAVRNPSSSTTQFRVVFDASAKTTTNISLNDILANGPVLQDDLFSILARFRTHAIVFSADITKMYRQVEVTASHQKWQMIVWRENENQPLKYYKLCTLTYGTTCASYLAIKALQTLAEEHKKVYPEASIIAKKDFNVDDIMTGANDIEKALVLQQQLIDMCNKGHFKLHKWCSNHPMLLETIPKMKQEVSLDINAEKTDTKALGIKWIPKDDIFMLSYVQKMHEKITKRTVLSELAQLFDPLGLVNPVIVLAKIFLQELCKLKLHWDAAVPVHLHGKWIEFRKQMVQLNDVQLPRRVLVDDPIDIQLHVFSDASEKAYGSVAYLRSTNANGETLIRLLCSKSRVAPIQPLTLPRLELCGALLSVELAAKLNKSLGLNISSTTYWTDSEIVLSWVLSDGQYKTFVANRVASIKRKTLPGAWRYINTKMNPADLVSRGMTPESLLSSQLWWEGPAFLQHDQQHWPMLKPAFVREITEEKTIKTVLTSAIEREDFLDRINHHNSIKTLQRIVAYALRTLPKNRNQNKSASKILSVDELKAAMTTILRHVQKRCFPNEFELLKKGKGVKSKFSNFSPIIDADGIIRVGGRLRTADMSFEQKHPILLPKNHVVTKLILEHLHRTHMHAGPQSLLAIARQRYWPENGKRLTQDIVKNCVLCVKSKPRLMEQIMGDLPKERITIARAFHSVNIDFAGPVEIHSTIRGKRTTKGYICIFVCCSTKAVHMEAAIDLSINGFISCLKRFIARRGKPTMITSDNATNLRGVHNQLQELSHMMSDGLNQETIFKYCQDHEIIWKFSPARSPHFNGLAEAAVKSAKWHLRKILHSTRITYDELVTITAEVEAILNSRPLTPMSSNPDDLQPLTAGHFLIGGPLTALEDRRIIDQPKTKIWFKLVDMRNEFWRRWSSEYLAELQSKAKWRRGHENVKIGALVVIKEDNVAPLKWRLGRVTQTFSDASGKVRVVELRTSVVKIPDVADAKKRLNNMVVSTHLTRRAIHRICPLPVEVNDDDPPQANPVNSDTQPAEQPQSSVSLEQIDQLKPNQGSADVVIEQSGENEQLNADTIVEAVSAIAKPQGKLLKPSSTPQDAETSAPPDEPIARRTRSTLKKTLCSVTAVALVFLALVSKAKANLCEYESFNHNPGLYFENVGKMALTHDTCNIVCVLRLDQLWNHADDLDILLRRLDVLCKDIKPPKLCDVTTTQLRQQVSMLKEQSELIKEFSHKKLMRKRRSWSDGDMEISPSEKVRSRAKRGWANFVGSTLKIVTGVMDNDDSERIQRQVQSLNDTYHHTMQLIDDQTTIQDITQNIIKRDEIQISKQFTLVNNQILELRNITIESSHFDALSVQTLAMIESYRERMNAILDLITQIRHGHVSTLLISPQQLKQNLVKIADTIDRNLMIPGDGIQQNLVQIYRMIKAKVSMGKQNLIIKLALPLIGREFYDLYHIIPVPFQDKMNTMRMIETKAQYICINTRQDEYYMISRDERGACQAFSNDITICEQKHMLYNIYNGTAECEMAIFTHKAKAISPRCSLTSMIGEQTWSKLHVANTFLFTIKTWSTVNMICKNETATCTMQGSGILRLAPQCMLQTANFEIVSSNDVEIGEMSVVIPTINISDFVIETPMKIASEFEFESKQQSEQMTKLQEAIEHQKKQIKNSFDISSHNIHHYTMVYVVLITLIVCIGSFTYRVIKLKKQAIFEINPEVNSIPIPTPRQQEHHNVTFTV